MTIQTTNPATGEIIKTYAEMSDEEISGIVSAVHAASQQWRQTDFVTRAVCMQKMATLLRQRKKEFAVLMATEMGKPLSQGEAEIEKCAFVCEHFAEHASVYLQPRIIQTEMQKSYVAYQPLGIILAIMPWNFPFWQVFRFAAPNTMAGNAALLKHAPISTGTALCIEKLFQEAGFPENLFRTLVVSDSRTDNLIAHPQIAAVTLTGSPNAGKMVGAAAANALKKSVLELGGNDPYLILEDANLDQAAEACVVSRMNNAGQVCIAAKRVIIVSSIREKFLSLLQDKLHRYRMGNPLDPHTDIGPLARLDIRDKVHQQVMRTVSAGAELILGGVIPPGNGFYYPPTLLDKVGRDSPAFNEEIFGPVVAVIHASDEAEAISLANDSPYGLGAAVFTQDVERGERIAVEKIEAGSCSVNTFVSSDPRLPFGGIKHSGYGRELSAEGIRSFVNIKTINVK